MPSCDRMEEIARNQHDGYRAEIAELNHELHLLIFESAASRGCLISPRTSPLHR
ncbi:hypothetical protein ABFP37_07745 [Burkholderia sp. RS01]|uniref:hypothetical protein n=1 Tax=Bacteria TaxID=2 RepID=UPI0021B114A4|nr:hypothetical protein [Arthrobacter sp. KBS0703]